VKIKFLLLSVYLFSFATAFAEEQEAAHHEPSIWDLKYPAINFIVLFGFIAWKAKKPLTEMFNKNAENIRALMESAEKQSKDANAKLATLEQKMKNIDSELVKITTDYESDVAAFGKNQIEETQTTITRMKRDVDNKLQGEKKELMDGLSHELLNLVVSNTQNTINGNRDLKSKATNNIIVGLK